MLGHSPPQPPPRARPTPRAERKKPFQRPSFFPSPIMPNPKHVGVEVADSLGSPIFGAIVPQTTDMHLPVFKLLSRGPFFLSLLFHCPQLSNLGEWGSLVWKTSMHHPRLSVLGLYQMVFILIFAGVFLSRRALSVPYLGALFGSSRKTILW